MKFPEIKKEQIDAARDRAKELQQKILGGLEAMSATADRMNSDSFEDEKTNIHQPIESTGDAIELLKEFYEEFEALEKRVARLEGAFIDFKFKKKGE